ncbi:MAG TPA: NAD(P)H-dependent glycerol-3-phosphate dehydrogenase [Terriglobales bacterium]|nr:NAD(P)H-dependent glycerol-3-phosphate dehydrogenase [Terriglobales bacterium]
MARIAVIGAGAWGTALSMVLARNGAHQVQLWAFEKEVCESISARHVNQLFLPGFELPQSVCVTNDLATAATDAEIVVSVMPSHHCRAVFKQIAASGSLKKDAVIVSATKGIEEGSLLRMTQVIAEVLAASRHHIAAISGPSFAKEVARGDPTAITVASENADLAARVQREFSDSRFRIYTSDDVAGVELGGSLKNVIAIAAGVCDGLGLGHNTIAALITRGLAEITRLAVACGAKPPTLAGLAGMGDLVLTCTGGLSRNRSVGVELGKGHKLPEIIAGMHGMVAEGVHTTNAAIGLAQKYKIEMPITQQMHAILHQGKPPREAIHELMTRPGKVE